MSEMLKMSELEKKVFDNKIEFIYKEDTYRVRHLNLLEAEELKKVMAAKTVELLEDKNVRREEELIALWKEKGIDIDKLTEEFNEGYKAYNKALYELGKCVSEQATEKELSIYEKRCEELRAKVEGIQLKKSELLSASYESQALELMYKYMIYFGLEKKEGDKFIKPYKSYEDMLISMDSELLYKALLHTMMVESHESFKS